MIIKNVTRDDLEKALAMVNVKYKNNITWEKLEPYGKHWRARLRVRDSRGPGARLGFGSPGSQRHLIAACWHVTGNWFDALFAVNPSAVVDSLGKRITKDHGNWVDRNIGSQVYPMMWSEACECNERGLDGV
jgi:hypothetical protein